MRFRFNLRFQRCTSIRCIVNHCFDLFRCTYYPLIIAIICWIDSIDLYCVNNEYQVFFFLHIFQLHRHMYLYKHFCDHMSICAYLYIFCMHKHIYSACINIYVYIYINDTFNVCIDIFLSGFCWFPTSFLSN